MLEREGGLTERGLIREADFLSERAYERVAYKKGGVQKRGLIEEQGSQKSLQYFCLPR